VRRCAAREIWNDEVARPVAGGWPMIEVDTTGPVELGRSSR
jgi:hypothetical protein